MGYFLVNNYEYIPLSSQTFLQKVQNSSYTFALVKCFHIKW